ncbi:beta-1,6-N-acetylglucosaminyltransferase [Flavobacterium sp. EDS]|uniref:beta-1,6-N-acetylglucosaminyltransferase n=1 Tax=Flavobacterium sp. EDS TaxID=2897328 RepID=UPI001E64F47D|nr:beta-1,6-N-acetylglucosaminyltransferase [Flavobacterium sp. EDS]MCD0473689.1 beta-1,6-N-acetylglucosaminyltransferase [Flavobacterium sp. EDS]
MQINYIILAHRYPKQLRRLIQKLTTPEAFFYVHIDKNTSIDLFVKELADLSNISFVGDRKQGIWGDIGIVNATMNALKQIVRDKKDGYCVLLSGQDYPIKSNDDIKFYFASNLGNEFIDIVPLPTKHLSIDRIEKYKFNLSSRKEDFIQIGSILEADFFTKETLKKIYRLIRVGRYDFILKVLKRRKYPNYIKPYGGSQWWALTTQTAEKIIQFVDEYPDFVKYHTYSLIPDEMFFQSIIMYLIEENNKIKIMPFLTYVNWEKKNCDLPVTFSTADFEELISQSDYKLFARKFDSNISEVILDKIDAFHS